jgi:hypothetical protein
MFLVLLMMLKLYAMNHPVMLRINREWRCHVTYYLYRCFVDFVDFACLAQASQLAKPA